jgi:glucokinase
MYLGIDIGGTNFKYGIVNHLDEIVYSNSLPSCPEKGKEYLLSKLLEVCTGELIDRFSIKSIGIGLPGIICKNGVVKVLPNLPGWDNTDLKSILNQNLNIPFYIDNDARMAAIAELTSGAGRDFNDFLYVTLGTGIGSAIIINREIYRGYNNSAGEIGHIIIDCNAKKEDFSFPYRIGILEEYAGRTQIIAIADRILISDSYSYLHNINDFDVVDISREAENGDRAAIKIISQAAEYIGIGLVSVMNFLDIRFIVIGGGIAKSELLLKKIEETIKFRALPNVSEYFKIVRAKFQADTGIIGSAIAAKFYAK